MRCGALECATTSQVDRESAMIDTKFIQLRQLQMLGFGSIEYELVTIE